MFTPPPSPLPAQATFDDAARDRMDTKSSKARRTKMLILLVPAALVLVTLSTRYLASLADSEDVQLHSWSLGKRQLPSSSIPTPTRTISPQIPSASPVLPTPFPQPFDNLSANFSTASCSAFFANMTTTPSFRSCRPFSLLLSSSSSFLTQAQRNLTLMNTIVWGTCNTTLGVQQCTSNMAGFASTLKTACAVELVNQNPLVTTALDGLVSYHYMSSVGCTSNLRTNTYCYIDAVSSSNPSDAYYFSLGIGVPLPNSTVSSCSTCIQSIMNVYASNANSGANGPGDKSGLSRVFQRAMDMTTQQCGADFVQHAALNASPADSLQPAYGVFGLIILLAISLSSFNLPLL